MKSDFQDLILKKNPNAIIQTDEKGHHVAVEQDENKAIKILGCDLCYDAEIKMSGRQMKIGDIDAISLSSVSEDDSFNPLMNVLFLCPVCSRMIVRPDVAAQPVIGRSIEDWKD